MYSKYVERHPIAEAVELHQGAWGRQRTDSTHVLGALCVSLANGTGPRRRCAGCTECCGGRRPRVARRERADPEWFERYARRMEDQRLPKGNKAREQYLKAGRPKPTKAKTLSENRQIEQDMGASKLYLSQPVFGLLRPASTQAASLGQP
jgi:hypothetical protein